jgi:hypothetical protein
MRRLVDAVSFAHRSKFERAGARRTAVIAIAVIALLASLPQPAQAQHWRGGGWWRGPAFGIGVYGGAPLYPYGYPGYGYPAYPYPGVGYPGFRYGYPFGYSGYGYPGFGYGEPYGARRYYTVNAG